MFARELDKRNLVLLPVTVTLEKNMPIGSGLGSSACSIVAALDALNQFHGNPLESRSVVSVNGGDGRGDIRQSAL